MFLKLYSLQFSDYDYGSQSFWDMLQFRLPNAPGVSKLIRKKIMSECCSAPTNLRRRSSSGSSSPGRTNPKRPNSGGGDSE